MPDPTRVEIIVFGGLRVGQGSRGGRLGGPQERALLALLLTRRGSATTLDAIADALWGDDPPPTAAKTVQVYVSRLRRLLGPDVIASASGGYRLEAGAVSLDATAFEAHVADGGRLLAAGDFGGADPAFTEALRLAGGPPYADVADWPFLLPEIARLEELRWRAAEGRFAALLELGSGPELVADLHAAVRAQPHRERLRGQLMLALYRSGRQTEALEAYQDGRRLLADELGVDPGPELEELQLLILRHDPTLRADRPDAGRLSGRGTERVGEPGTREAPDEQDSATEPRPAPVPPAAEPVPQGRAAAAPRRTRPGRSATLLATTAMVILMAALAGANALRDPAAARASLSPTAAASAPTTAVESPSVAAIASPTRSEIPAPTVVDVGVDSAPIPLEPGFYRWSKFDPPLEFVLASQWFAGADSVDSAELLEYGQGGPESGPPLGSLDFLRAQLVLTEPCYRPEVTYTLGDRAFDFIDWVTRQRLLKMAGPVLATPVAGLPGLSVGVTAIRAPTVKECPAEAGLPELLKRIPLFPASEHALVLFADDRARAIAADLSSGPPLVILMEAGPSNWDEFSAAAQRVVDSLAIPSR